MKISPEIFDELKLKLRQAAQPAIFIYDELEAVYLTNAWNLVIKPLLEDIGIGKQKTRPLAPESSASKPPACQ